MRSLVVAIALLGPACGSAAAAPDCDTALAPPPGAELLCDEHVIAKDSEIHWTSYATSEPRSTVDARYAKLVGTCSITGTVQPDLDLARGQQRFATYDASAKSYPWCSVSPKPSHRTVIVVSVMTKR